MTTKNEINYEHPYVTSSQKVPKWKTLPETPTLPQSDCSGYASVNGVDIWYAAFGKGSPVFLLHGGLANSNYFGFQVPALAEHYRVVVMDSRGHGRSSRDEQSIGYHLMATDVIAMMDYFKMPKVAIVGWSDGAIVGLDIAINHPCRLTGLFAFAANSDPGAVKDVSNSDIFNSYLERVQNEYQQMSETPGDYAVFLGQIIQMWNTQPDFTGEKLRKISVPTWIVDGDHDEAIKRDNPLFMADQIAGSGLLIQPSVSHFSFLQDPKQFNDDVLHFLESTDLHCQ